MRILLAGLFSPSGRNPVGGLQSWQRTVREELERRGHDCTEWEHGQDIPNRRFDLGVVANAAFTHRVAILCKRVVNVSHGPIAEERPAAQADMTFYVSEGVRLHWVDKGRPNGGIARQPINLDFWTPGGSKERRGVVRFSYRGTDTHAETVAQAMGEPYQRLHGVTPEGARVVLRRAALVFASGRAALEAMACGAPTVVYDFRQAYQGPLMDENLYRQMLNSYSGRGGFAPRPEQVIAAGERPTAKSEGCGRGWVERHHDARTVVR